MTTILSAGTIDLTGSDWRASPPSGNMGGLLDPGQILARTKKSDRSLALVVLAAGKGKRLRSSNPKVLHPVCGRPILWHVLAAGVAARPARIVIVVGHGADDVKAAASSWDLTPSPIFVEQSEQLGTGHAVMVAEKAVGKVDDVLIANGDFDPVTAEDVRALLRRHHRSRGAATLISTELDDPGRYGRVIREGARLLRIAEHADATPAERSIHEVATNWIAVRRADLAAVERVVRERVNAGHLANGVTLIDPATTYIDVGVTIGRETVIHPLSFLEGKTRVGARCRIGPSARIVDSRIGDDSEVNFSVVLDSRLGDHTSVGPFARLRPGTRLSDGAKAGTFVDVKNAKIGRGSKVPHLSYVGDATLGDDVNIGAGTVTVNYDGYTKHRTVIGDGARIGSDTMLVAPVRVGKDATTGAGSVITKDVTAGALGVERAEQRVVPGYRERKDDEHRAGGRTTRKR